MDAALELVAMLERGDTDGVAARLAPRHRGWPVGDWLRDVWRPTLDDVAGDDRTIGGAWAVGHGATRIVLEGSRGRGFATVRLDDDGTLGGITARWEDRDGIANVVVTAPWPRRQELGAFYASLIGRSHRRPRLVFDEGEDTYPVAPTDVHLDLVVPDVDEHHVVTDPIGHPVCLRTGDEPEIGAVVFDCDDPAVEAAFWSALLDMSVRVEESDDRVVIARADGVPPRLAFRRVDGYQPTTWPDPRRPAQGHLDLCFDDRPAAEARILAMGGTRHTTHGSCPVYADPAGHPFCVGFPGE